MSAGYERLKKKKKNAKDELFLIGWSNQTEGSRREGVIAWVKEKEVKNEGEQIEIRSGKKRQTTNDERKKPERCEKEF